MFSDVKLKLLITLFRIGGGGGGGKKAPSQTNFSNVTSINVGISHQDFLTLSFNPFVILV